MRRPAGAAEIARGYMPQLDGLRCFAVIGVLVTHAWVPRPLPWIFGGVDWGGLGVLLFFVLSGFLITGILLDCRERAEAGEAGRMFFIRQFYIRRFLRIFPLYYGVLVVLVIANFERTRELAVWLFTYTSNIFLARHGWAGHLGHFWSLAVEEQFYLVWPWLLLFLPRRRFVPFLVIVIVLAPLYRLYLFQRYGLGNETQGIFTLAVLDGLGIGALVAVVARSVAEATLRRWLSYVALPVALSVYVGMLALQHYAASAGLEFVLGGTAAATVFGWLVFGAARGFSGALGRLLRLRPVVYVGKISYGVYIFHNLVIGAVIVIAPRIGVDYRPRGILNLLGVTAVTISIAACSWHFFERPINGLKRRFAYRDRRGEEERIPALAPSATGL